MNNIREDILKIAQKDLKNVGGSLCVSLSCFDSFKINNILKSDDGFVLYIDNKKVAEFIGDRPIAKNEVTLFLKKGKHTFKLSYFQGGGNLGIKAFYKIGNEIHLVGENSSFVKFY
jgi:hypothetical protein